MDSTAGVPQQITRRSLFKTLGLGTAGLALWAGEVERHWIDVVHRDIFIAGLPEPFNGMRVVQLSDIHLNEYTEPFLLREAIDHINHLQPDMVLLTGDYVSAQVLSKRLTMNSAEECAALLSKIACPQRYAILGNHDCWAGQDGVTDTLREAGIPVLRNAFLPLEKHGSRIWLAGLEDPVCGRPDPDKTMPVAIRKSPHEPIILMCHAPDFIDELAAHPVSQSISLVLSGHTHGGQVRLPLLGALRLPPLGQKYVQGWFSVGSMQLYVNRGIGTVGAPFRFDCRPEITHFTLRPGRMQKGLAAA